MLPQARSGTLRNSGTRRAHARKPISNYIEKDGRVLYEKKTRNPRNTLRNTAKPVMATVKSVSADNRTATILLDDRHTPLENVPLKYLTRVYTNNTTHAEYYVDPTNGRSKWASDIPEPSPNSVLSQRITVIDAYDKQITKGDLVNKLRSSSTNVTQKVPNSSTTYIVERIYRRSQNSALVLLKKQGSNKFERFSGVAILIEESNSPTNETNIGKFKVKNLRVVSVNNPTSTALSVTPTTPITVENNTQPNIENRPMNNNNSTWEVGINDVNRWPLFRNKKTRKIQYTLKEPTNISKEKISAKVPGYPNVEVLTDPKSGNPYFHNTRKGTAEWSLPISGNSLLNGLGPSSTHKLPSPWEARLSENTATEYYYNPETGTQQWEFPKGTENEAEGNSTTNGYGPGGEGSYTTNSSNNLGFREGSRRRTPKANSRTWIQPRDPNMYGGQNKTKRKRRV